MPWSKSVFSSNISEVGYDEESQTLSVTFLKGGVYEYSGVPEEVAIDLSKAASVTGMLNSEIKGRYGHRRVR